MKPDQVILVGAGGHARACIDVIELEGRFTVAGLIGLEEEVGTRVLGYPVVASDADALSAVKRCGRAIITVGQIKTPAVRMRLFAMLVSSGCDIPAIVSPLAHVSRHASIGAGTIVMHGAVVNAGATVGRNCIINSLALVEHDATIADHCHISTAAAVNSTVRVGEGTFIGSNSSVRQCITIGSGCVIGMGQRIISDCEDGARVP